MAPGTTFIWDDQSLINVLTAPAADTTDRPVFMTVFSSDKGPERFQKNLSGENFLKLFDKKPNFFKHGQPLLQAFSIAQAGGLQFAKRVVADDSKLANLTLVATVTSDTIQRTDENGNPLYVGPDGEYTTDSNDGENAPANRTVAKIRYELKGIDLENNTNDVDAVFGNILSKVTLAYGSKTHDGVYPLFTITDTGRGISKKKIRITLDTSSRRPIKFAKYHLSVIEDDEILENGLYFTLDPYKTEYLKYNDASLTNLGIATVIGLQSANLMCNFNEEEYNNFLAKVAEYSELPVERLNNLDMLFGTDEWGEPIGSTYNSNVGDISPAVIIDDSPGAADFANIAGNALLFGDNGSFGDSPITDPDHNGYNDKILEVFQGNAADGDEIYDLDNTPIYVIFDADYDMHIKEAIADLVNFREDCFYYRDIGRNITNIIAIKEEADKYIKSRFVGTYINSYDVIEPYYRKQVNVTVMYNLVSKFVDHFINGANRPFAGQAYGITFENDIIPGTINFKPKKVPATSSNNRIADQKQFFDDNRLNYIAYYSGIPTMDTEYTSQEAYTQLSWSNNVILVQNIIREIRRMCPRNRYTFLDGQDLIKYKKDVTSILNKYSSQFKSIEVSYIEDSNYAHNKIFYAALVVVFRDFVQSEIFKITAINED